MKKKIIIFLAILIIILIFYNLFFNKKTTNDNNNELKYATVTIHQDKNSIDSTILNNIVNSEEKIYKKATYTYSTFINSKIEDNHLYISINNSAKDIILFDDMNVNTNSLYEISGITKTIKSVFIGHCNTVIDYPVLFILFEDNTAQYVDVEKSFYSGKFSIAGTINIDNIDFFSNVEVTTKDNKNYIGIVATDIYGNGYEITTSMIGR